MEDFDHVIVTPHTKRAKARVKQHGECMVLLTQEDNQVMVRSLHKTWSGETHWFGWFTKEEATITTS
jgi:hypothetical protein